ncbi:MAG TPA: phosphotransferase, partial [Anaeromyxobacteraceae bacterium]|nr:phosphotransferase [Anaeromyxobacteraceae bacterium]
MAMTDRSQLAEVVRRALRGETLPDVVVERRALRGGLTATSVTELRLRYAAGGVRLDAAVVVKQLSRESAREAFVYERLLPGAGALAPRLVDVTEGPEGLVLVLERVRRATAWPWRDTARAGAVLATVARLHARPPQPLPPDVAAWDYERELAASAAATLAELESASPPPGDGRRWPAAATRRLVAALKDLRAELLALPGLGPALLHGDLHPGNVVVHGRGRIVLLDWERTRIGSPLEDVASWLVSLGHHEPEARRRHDTLLGVYLAARGLPARIGPEVRRAYWIASASNALAGALRYHLLRAGDPALAPAERAAGAGTARAW